MDKGLGNESSSSSAPINNSSSSTDMFLKQVNKNSLKITKPFRKPSPLPNPTIAASIPVIDPNPHDPEQGPPQSQQPPVYNINKSDFRDVVQKLTGSPAHERLPTPPAVTHPRPPSSRLQRIRPPPLAQIGNRPNQITQFLPRPHYGSAHAPPLPPLPSVHAAAESPISAYMRFLHNPSPSLVPWNGVAPIGGPPQNEFGQLLPPPFSPLQPTESPVSAYLRLLQNSTGCSSAPPVPPTQQPLSPLQFGCIPSPRSPYGMMARGCPFSPTAQLGLPQQLPPTPISSPR
ncbi:hypothetical protein CASFOL_034556 [Castilleja foliolosa]|uniref:VQ domain-containing protein n=1 Tax=Castilleja foliolosa TaxID=1961234 RepID=A0ABD3BR99_9LAMI